MALHEQDTVASSKISASVNATEFDDNEDEIHIHYIATSITGNQPSPSKSQSKTSASYPWKKLLTNKIFWSRIILIPPAIFLLFLCISYTISPLLHLKLDNYWCDDEINLQKIRDHSIQHGYSKGIMGECWDTSAITRDQNLWSRQSYNYEWTYDSSAISRFSMLFMITSILSMLIIYYITQLIIDAIKYRNGTLSTLNNHPNARRNRVNMSRQNCFRELHKYYMSIHKWYGKKCAVDTANWILLKVSGEVFEILTQTIALWAYNGTAIIATSTLYLAIEQKFIQLFGIFLFLNCASCTVLWFFYAIKQKLCYGLLFQLLLVSIDVLFDTFYAFFPMLIIMANNDDEDEYDANGYQNFLVSLASLNTDNKLSSILTLSDLWQLYSKSLAA